MELHDRILHTALNHSKKWQRKTYIFLNNKELYHLGQSDAVRNSIHIKRYGDYYYLDLLGPELFQKAVLAKYALPHDDIGYFVTPNTSFS